MPAHQIATVPLSPLRALREATAPLNHAALAALAVTAGPVAAGPPRIVSHPVSILDDSETETWRYGNKQLGLRTEIRVYNVDGPVALDWRANFMGLPWGRLYGYGRLDAAGEGYASLMLEGVASDTLDRAAEAFREALHEAGLHAGTLADLDDLASIDRALGLWKPGSTGLAHDQISALQTVVAEADPRSMAADTARFVLARALIVRGEGNPENLRDAHGLLGTLMEKGKDLRFVRGLASGLAADGSLHYLYQPYAAPAPRPAQEVLLAAARVAELCGDPALAESRLRAVLAYGDRMPPFGITPAGEAAAQIDRMRASFQQIAS